MQMTDSRLFKATRRTIRAEITLIIVILISFSWSAYALYKLFLGNSDSLFDLGHTNGASSVKKASANLESVPASDPLNAQGEAQNLTEQLTNYKSRILKELLARQRRLLLGSDELSSVGDSDYGQRQLLSAPQINRVNLQPPMGVEELKQRRGVNKLPASTDYLFDTNSAGQRDGSPLQVAQRATSLEPIQGDRLSADSNDYARTSAGPRNGLIPMTYAPSLMQLSKTTNSGQRPDARVQVMKEFNLLHDEELDDEPPPTAHEQMPASVEQNTDDLTREQASGSPATTTELPTGADNEGLETTTLEPTAAEETTPSPLASGEGPSESDRSALKSPESDEDNQVAANDDKKQDGEEDEGSLERVKNTVHAIDEEVDRMTQPSLGMASQQDKSFDYKNTVQFDDSLPANIQRDLEHDIRTKMTRLASHSSGPSVRNKNRRTDESDLQMADNRVKPPVDVSLESPSLRQLDEKGEHRSEPKRTVTKRDSEIVKRKLGQSRGRRERRSIETNLISQTLDSIDPKVSARKRKASRRSDDSPYEEDEAEEDDDGDSGAQDAAVGGEEQPDSTAVKRLRDSYQTITSNDPSLQDLLAHKQLLDALQQSQPPAPLQPQQQRLNRTFLEPGNVLRQPLAATKAIKQNGVQQQHQQQEDHQPADTHYTVDHGLLLYPASDEEHEHKSMAKKSKKSSQKKAKKKMTVAVKKGGHKKKKHKKEEKKYLKEKKFKGAKKGKKMAKGKGGKGGKKGKKYYKDKGFKKKGFKNIYVKNEFGQKKSYFDEFRDKDFKKKWKNFDDKYKYAQMKKWQAKDVKGAKKMKDQGEKFKKYDKGKWKKKYHKHQESESAKKKKKYDDFR